MVDKPGKSRDFYHTCYGLSGLSVAQHSPGGRPIVVGDAENAVARTHPVYNVELEAAAAAAKYFKSLKVPEMEVDRARAAET